MRPKRKWLKRLLRGLGWELVKYRPKSHALARRKLILDRTGVDVVIDVGANAGQFGRQLRDLGYLGAIESFEPMREAFERLTEIAAGDPQWNVHRFGLGSANGQAVLHIAANSYSSSILEILPQHVRAAPHSRYVREEQIEIRTLDSVLPPILNGREVPYLKVDTQGFEREVLLGGRESLAMIPLLQLELSLVPLYQGAPLLPEMCELASDLGYQLISIEPGFVDEESGEVLQVDGIFRRPVGSTTAPAQPR